MRCPPRPTNSRACEGAAGSRTTRSVTPARLPAFPSPMRCAGTPASRCAGSTIPWTVYGAVTQGTIGDPRLSDDNGGPQLAARVVFTPHPVLSIGGSVAAGPYLARALTDGIAGPRRAPQPSPGGLRRRRGGLARSLARSQRAGVESLGAARLRGRSETRSRRRRRRWWRRGTSSGQGCTSPAGSTTWVSRVSRPTTLGVVTWDADVTRIELGGGWTVHRHVLLKAVWQRNRRDGGRPRGSDLGAVQVAAWF